MGQLRFSGHDSFQCRNLWLKKGYDFVRNSDETNSPFNEELAVIDLGVGKNMVSSIRFWMKAFDMLDDENEQPTNLATYLLDKDGKDPFLEDLGTLWILHYKLVSKSEASIYNLVFNKFRKHRIEFKKSHLVNFLISECERLDEVHSPKSIQKDVGVFLKSYLAPDPKEGKKDIEDHYASLLLELNLVKKIENYIGDDFELDKDWYKIESSERESLPIEIFLYVILDNVDVLGRSISFQKLLNADNSPGNVFVMTPDALVSKISELTRKYDGIVYKDDAGVRELQINGEFNKETILEQYYGRN
jgi:hypothetical protein